jgi:hypothetical protein
VILTINSDIIPYVNNLIFDIMETQLVSSEVRTEILNIMKEIAFPMFSSRFEDSAEVDLEAAVLRCGQGPLALCCVCCDNNDYALSYNRRVLVHLKH